MKALFPLDRGLPGDSDSEGNDDATNNDLADPFDLARIASQVVREQVQQAGDIGEVFNRYRQP